MTKHFHSIKEFLNWLPARDRNIMVVNEDGEGGLNIIYENENNNDDWINLEASLPELSTNVLVERPNQYSKKVDILIAQLFDSGTEGRSYGRLGEGNWLTGKYWALPAVVPLKHITHWMPLPVAPKWEAVFNDIKF